MRGIKIPLHDIALKIQGGGLCARGGGCVFAEHYGIIACSDSLDCQQAISHALQRLQYGSTNFQLSACTSNR